MNNNDIINALKILKKHCSEIPCKNCKKKCLIYKALGACLVEICPEYYEIKTNFEKEDKNDNI